MSPNDHARDVTRSCDVRMMGATVEAVERLQKITIRVLSFANATTHLLLDE
jgi:hypothetical protein